jgi:HK97 family phage major capsid protein
LKGNMGSFVPLGYFKDLFAAKKNTDALFNPDVVTFTITDKGNPLQVGFYDDTSVVAALVNEASGSAESDIAEVGGVMLGAFMFRSPVFHASIEAFQDVAIGGSIIDSFTKFSAERIARGVGPYLVTGTGVNQPTGLLTALEGLGGPAIVPQGAGANDGVSTSVNSIGSADIANLYYALDEAYRDSPKCAWLISSTTLGKLSAIVTKMGLPVVQWQGPEAWILGKPVRISPSMPSPGQLMSPIIFGDLSYYHVRATPVKVQQYKELPGLVENGKIGLRCLVRYDGQLCFGDSAGTSPCVYLTTHS